MAAHHMRIDPTPAGASLSLPELLVAVVKFSPLPDAPEPSVKLLDGSGTVLGTTTEACARYLWPPKLYDHGSPEHLAISRRLDVALAAGDPDAIEAATRELKSVRKPT